MEFWLDNGFFSFHKIERINRWNVDGRFWIYSTYSHPHPIRRLIYWSNCNIAHLEIITDILQSSRYIHPELNNIHLHLHLSTIPPLLPQPMQLKNRLPQIDRRPINHQTRRNLLNRQRRHNALPHPQLLHPPGQLPRRTRIHNPSQPRIRMRSRTHGTMLAGGVDSGGGAVGRERFFSAQMARVNSGWRLRFDSVWMRLRSSLRIFPLAPRRREPKGSSPASTASLARSMQR